MDLETIAMTMIVHAGNAKAKCFEALAAAKSGDFGAVERLMQEGKDELLAAHHMQTDLLQREATGEKQEVTLLMVHVQDLLMDSMLAKDLIEEMIDLYRALAAK